VQLLPARLRFGGQQIQVKPLDLVGSGVVQCGHKPRFVRNGDASRAQATAEFRVVEQLCQAARIDLAGLPTAGAAVQRGGVCVVAGLAAMPHQQHQRREVAIQPHGMQHACGQRHLGRCIQPHQLRAAQRPVAQRQTVQVVIPARLRRWAQPLPVLGEIAQAGRFHKGKCRTRPLAGCLPLRRQGKPIGTGA